jgi:Putative nucleotidyltransferase substrate binding domain
MSFLRLLRRKTIDFKRQALLPIANIARWAALSVASTAVQTQERLRAVAGSRMMTAEDADTLVDVFKIVQRVRLRHELEPLEAGEALPDTKSAPCRRSRPASSTRRSGGNPRGSASHGRKENYVPDPHG